MKGVPVERGVRRIHAFVNQKGGGRGSGERALLAEVIDDAIQAQWRFFGHNASVLLLPPPDGRQREKMMKAMREEMSMLILWEEEEEKGKGLSVLCDGMRNRKRRRGNER